MENKKPNDIQKYQEWLKERHNVEISNRTKTYYESVANRIKTDFEKSQFWAELSENLGEFDSEYMLKAGYHLLMRPKAELYQKPFESFLLKTFRRNILENDQWPDEPKNEWILPDNWYFKIDDIVRTLFVVKYLDGVEFMIDKIQCLCKKHDIACTPSLEAKEEGYYAAHVYIKQQFEIPKPTWDTERVEVSIEIQITTQLQEVIRQLLHRYYEERRQKVKEEDLKWQWNYRSDEFGANYLGHILHYVEGMIMEIRDRQKKGEML